MRRTTLAAVLLFCAATTTAGAATLTETIDRTFDVRPGANVVLSNVNGRIRVESWDQPRVRVIARKEVEASRNEVEEVLRDLRVEMQQKDGGVVVTTHYPKVHEGSSIFDWILGGGGIDRQVRYELTVPRTMNVEVSNTNGSILVANVAGRLDLDTTNGKIEVERCAGSLEASTTNGSIRAELLRLAKGAPVELETTNGRIEVALPRDFGVDVDARTTNGSIKSDLPVSTTKIGRSSLRGAVNGGGSPLRLRTTNGGIEIRAAGPS